MSITRVQSVASWVLQLLTAGILFQTLFFKFTAAEESVYIFSTIHAEPWGRIGSGIIELLATILLLIPATVPYGAAMALATAGGALLSHAVFLGVVVKDDGGLLFGLALVLLIASASILVIRRHEIQTALGRFVPAPREGTASLIVR